MWVLGLLLLQRARTPFLTFVWFLSSVVLRDFASAFSHIDSAVHYRYGKRLQASHAGDYEMPGDEGEGQYSRSLEICSVTTNGDIEECRIVTAHDLSEMVGKDEARRLLNSPDLESEDLLFAVPPSLFVNGDESNNSNCQESGSKHIDSIHPSKERTNKLFTIGDWKACLVDDTCQVPTDILLRAFGPDVAEKAQLRENTEAMSSRVLEKEPLEERKQDSQHFLVEREMKVREELTESKKKHALELEENEREYVAPIYLRGEKPRFHVHFGAGRLGIGLVVPAIAASGIPFAVVQRPKKNWQQIFQSNDPDKKLDFCIDGNVVVHNVEVISTQTQGVPKFMPPHSLVFGDNPEEIEEIIMRATSFSCSLGAAMTKVITAAFDSLPPAESLPEKEQPILFCCENDHKSVAKLKEKMKGRAVVVDCMVDRVCMGRTIRPTSVEVEAEPWPGSIVVLEPGLDRRIPFSPSIATLPRSPREAEYLSMRKFTLVNGMHAVMAFLTLCLQYRGLDREYMLVKYAFMPRRHQLVVEAWRTARVAELIDEFGEDQLMEWHCCARRQELWDILLDYSDEVLVDRFSMVDDLVSRVLGGGISNRWLTRLRPTEQWMVEHRSRLLGKPIRSRRLFGALLSTGFHNSQQEEKVELDTRATTVVSPNAETLATVVTKLKANQNIRNQDPKHKSISCQLDNEISQLSKDDIKKQKLIGDFMAYALRRGPSAEAQKKVRSSSTESSKAVAKAYPVSHGKGLADFLNNDSFEEIAINDPETFILDACSILVRDSRTFCNKELQNFNQNLQKEQRKAGGKKFSPHFKEALEESLNLQFGQLKMALEANNFKSSTEYFNPPL